MELQTQGQCGEGSADSLQGPGEVGHVSGRSLGPNLHRLSWSGVGVRAREAVRLLNWSGTFWLQLLGTELELT